MTARNLGIDRTKFPQIAKRRIFQVSTFGGVPLFHGLLEKIISPRVES